MMQHHKIAKKIIDSKMSLFIMFLSLPNQEECLNPKNSMPNAFVVSLELHSLQ
jgi:hypothetical protein